MDNQDLLLTQNMGNRLQGHFYLSSDGNWYDGFYAPNTSAYAVTLYTQGGDKLSSLYSFDLSNNNKILDLNFDHALKINVGSSLQIGDFSVSGIGPYNFTAGGLNSAIASLSIDRLHQWPVVDQVHRYATARHPRSCLAQSHLVHRFGFAKPRL
jgi:hypothetical protein